MDCQRSGKQFFPSVLLFLFLPYIAHLLLTTYSLKKTLPKQLVEKPIMSPVNSSLSLYLLYSPIYVAMGKNFGLLILHCLRKEYNWPMNSELYQHTFCMCQPIYVSLLIPMQLHRLKSDSFLVPNTSYTIHLTLQLIDELWAQIHIHDLSNKLPIIQTCTMYNRPLVPLQVKWQHLIYSEWVSERYRKLQLWTRVQLQHNKWFDWLCNHISSCTITVYGAHQQK